MRTQLSLQGSFTAQSSALSSIQSLFDVTGQTGVLGALQNLYQSFSAWSADPNSSANQQNVLSQATAVAQAFQSTSTSLAQSTTQLNQQIGSTVQQINQLSAQIAADNAALGQSNTPDPSIQANLQSSLQRVSRSLPTLR